MSRCMCGLQCWEYLISGIPLQGVVSCLFSAVNVFGAPYISRVAFFGKTIAE